MKLFWVLVTCCFFGNVTFASTEGEESRSANVQVLFVNPGFSDESFWGDVDKYAIAAAQSLDIQLEIIHGQRDRILTQQKLAERMKKSTGA
ncbi:hypothetical protein JCM19235_4401 [Vibrio maritimus]|uniref:Autoinducer 2-binding periplasmic protein LuxP n=1 Tax=Vibrio maritimus TaxID=990268 RepID=A0A090RY36_9VIBR|nr:hypothetical protein JCM19235_4401 [Vibrio maritimus]